MKTKNKYYLALLCVILLASAILYGCKKNDLDSSNLDSSIKDYSYFKRTMSTDADILQFDSLVERNAFILRGKIYVTRRNGTHTVELARKKNRSRLSSAINSIKSESDFKNVLGLMGYEQESENLLEMAKMSAQKFASFVKRNPEFKKLTKSQRIELITNELISYRKRDQNIFRKVQEGATDQCSLEWSYVLQEALCRLYENYAMAEDAFAGCDDQDGWSCIFHYFVQLSIYNEYYANAVSQGEDAFVLCYFGTTP